MKHLYISRQIEPTLLEVIKSFPAVAITGPRQSGKSTLLKETLPEYNYVSFDDPVQAANAKNDPVLFLDALGERAIIDEIQYFPELLRYIKIRIDEKRDRNGQYVLTGSQQFTLIKNLGDSLAGRVVLLELLPFSIAEQCSIPNQKETSSLDLFLKACKNGSFPYHSIYPAENQQWFGSYLQTYIERDIRSIYNIGSLSDYQRFMQLLASRTSQLLNLTSLAGDIGVSVTTIKKWVSILEAGRIIYLLHPYFENFGKRIVKAPKVHFLDCGLVCYLTGISDTDHILKGPLGGALYESYCIQEVIKSFFNRGKQPRIFYMRTNNQLEVDLLIEHSYRKITPVEIKFSKTPKPAMADGIIRYINTFKEIEPVDSTVITLESPKMPMKRGVDFTDINSFIEKL